MTKMQSWGFTARMAAHGCDIPHSIWPEYPMTAHCPAAACADKTVERSIRKIILPLHAHGNLILTVFLILSICAQHLPRFTLRWQLPAFLYVLAGTGCPQSFKTSLLIANPFRH
jgi:hypothetical protein